MINYTTSTADTNGYKALITGRTDDINILLDYISKGNTVVLFGERRIGKTSILYLIRDIINGKIDSYKNTLIDINLKNIIDSLKTRVVDYKVIYRDIAPLQEEGETFEELVYKAIEDSTLFPPISRESSLSKTFKKLDSLLTPNKLLFLIDESERLCTLSQKKQDNILSNIKAITQNCPQIQFILAGAEPWYSNFKRDSNPLRNVKFYYLKSASPSTIREYLIRQPFLSYLNPTSPATPDDILRVQQTVEQIATDAAELTGYKPSYVQSICYEIKKILENNHHQLIEGWKKNVLEEIEEQEEDKTLRYFYKADYVDQISQNILALLAHKPELNFKEIAARLPHSANQIRDKLSDLESLDKIYKDTAEKYRIVGLLVEEWGKDNVPLPSIKNTRIVILKWIAAIILVISAISIYFYTHPSFKPISCKFITNTNDFPKTQILIDVPSSVERGETGKLTFLISNLDQKEIKPLTLTFSSLKNQIQYQKDNTNLIKIESLYIGETKYYTLDFIVRDSGSDKVSSSVISIISDVQNKSIETCKFNISLRDIQIKKYWTVFSLLLTAISGFLVKQDLTKLLTVLLGLFTDSSKVETDKKKDDKN
ncbi:MAG: hypothetical protein AB4060_02675 [Crocosphaera sp.]